MKWYEVKLGRVMILLAVGFFGLSLGMFTTEKFWAEEGCYTMFKIPIPTHEIITKHRRF